MTWEVYKGRPVISIAGASSVEAREALAIADAIYHAVDAARSESEPSLFDAPLARATDPGTSHAAAQAVRIRAASQKARLLKAYSSFPDGLTDDEAGKSAGLEGSGYWKRCSELRSNGWISRTGEVRAGDSGMAQEVCRITDSGRAAIMQATKDNQ